MIRIHAENRNPLPTGAYSGIDELLQSSPSLWHDCDMAGRTENGYSTGFSQLDGILPQHGWPRKGLMEIVTAQWGMGELQLLIPLMRSIIDQGKWILWVSPPELLHAPTLIQAGINTEQVLLLDLNTSCKDALWSMEKALQTKNCGLVLAWQNWLPNKVLRHLQSAADAGETLGVLFKHHVSEHSQSSLALQIEALPCESSRFDGSKISLLKTPGNPRPASTRVKLYQSD